MRSEERETQRQQKATERDELRKLPDAFKLNLAANPDRFYEIIQGTYRPPTLEGEDPRITAPINRQKFAENGRKVRGEDVGEAGNDVPAIRRSGETPRLSSGASSSKYASIVQTLDRHEFSDDPERRKSQMDFLENSMRTAIQELKLRDVAANTREAFGQYVKATTKVPGGIRVVFDFGKGQVAVVAQGNFYGDETISVAAEGGKLVGQVVKVANGQKAMLPGFSIKAGKI